MRNLIYNEPKNRDDGRMAGVEKIACENVAKVAIKLDIEFRKPARFSRKRPGGKSKQPPVTATAQREQGRVWDARAVQNNARYESENRSQPPNG